MGKLCLNSFQMLLTKNYTFPRKPDYSELTKFCLELWREIDIYTQWQSADKPFVLHDGPPYANGDIHLGHALNKILKDAVNRFMAMRGYRPHFMMGWDCNGLPIESKIENVFATKRGLKMSQIKSSPENVASFREACREFALGWVEKQRVSFEQLGVIAHSDIWTTIDLKNQVSILELIHKFAQAGLIYRDLKPVMWSCEEGTALAESEIDYLPKKIQSIDVALLLESTQVTLLQDLMLKKPVFIPIWTTTPWNIPANRAVAYGNNIEYSILEDENGYYLVATDLVVDFSSRAKRVFQVIDKLIGSSLQDSTYLYPMSYCGTHKYFPILHSDHVTSAQGTGFVHIAPDYHIDDFQLCKDNGIDCCNYINDNGYFISDLPDELSFLSGKFYTDAEAEIIHSLNENKLILSYVQIENSYPHSWRSKKPLIYRATNQWFINIKELRDECVKAASAVQWLPQKTQERFSATLKTRSEWCISRQRLWGTPIALFYHKTTGSVLLNEEVLVKTCNYLAKNGIESWWNNDIVEQLLDDQYRKDFLPIKDIVDVWFESGATQRFILQVLNKYPADMYLEGSDQHRGWFQSSMINGYFEKHEPPYKCVRTHGYLVDTNGKKMSKSSGNGTSPEEIIEKYGPDVLRLWVLRQDVDGDISWSHNQMRDTETMYLKMRNTIKFLIQNAKEHKVEYKTFSALEQWLLHRVYSIQRLIDTLPNGYLHIKPWEIHTVVHKIYEFCDTSLSRLYFDIRKDVLYWEHDSSEIKHQVQHCLFIILQYLMRWLAPIIPFATEEAWRVINHGTTSTSIHIEKFQNTPSNWDNSDSASLVDKLLKIRRLINLEIEPLRESGVIKTTLDATISLTIKNGSELSKPNVQSLLKTISIISDLVIVVEQVETKGDLSDDVIYIQASTANGYKCTKCKRRVLQIKNDLCARCSINLT